MTILLVLFKFNKKRKNTRKERKKEEKAREIFRSKNQEVCVNNS